MKKTVSVSKKIKPTIFVSQKQKPIVIVGGRKIRNINTRNLA